MKCQTSHIPNPILIWSERIVLESIFETSDICQLFVSVCIPLTGWTQSLLIVSNSPQQSSIATFDRSKSNRVAVLHISKSFQFVDFFKENLLKKERKNLFTEEKGGGSCFVFNLQRAGWELNDRVMAKLGRKLHLCLALSFCLISMDMYSKYPWHFIRLLGLDCPHWKRNPLS